MTDTETPVPTPFERPSYSTLLNRAMRLKCPRCGDGKLFINWFRMPLQCETCRFRFERGPGYFLGASYISYGVTALSITVMFILGRFVWRLPTSVITPPLAVFALVVPLLLFRFARAYWLAIDCHLDSSVLVDEDIPE